MRRTLSALVVAAAVAGFAAPAFAGCGGMKTAQQSTYETASADHTTTTKPVQQTQLPASK